MGVIWPPLVLIQLYRNDGSHPGVPALPPGMSPRLAHGLRALSAGHLVGEKLGLEISELSERLHEVWVTTEGQGRGLFIDEDLPILIDGYTRIRDALCSSIDERGHPTGPGGERLKKSPSIDQYPDGTLATRHRSIKLSTLLEWLDELIRFLVFARDHELLVGEGELHSGEDADA